MISDNECNFTEKQHYLAAKILDGHFKKKIGYSGECCINCLKSFVNQLTFKNHKC